MSQLQHAVININKYNKYINTIVIIYTQISRVHVYVLILHVSINFQIISSHHKDAFSVSQVQQLTEQLYYLHFRLQSHMHVAQHMVLTATVKVSRRGKILNPQQQEQQPFNGRLSGTTRVGRHQKKHSPVHTNPGQRTSFITFLHLQQTTASSLFSLRA